MRHQLVKLMTPLLSELAVRGPGSRPGSVHQGRRMIIRQIPASTRRSWIITGRVRDGIHRQLRQQKSKSYEMTVQGNLPCARCDALRRGQTLGHGELPPVHLLAAGQ